MFLTEKLLRSCYQKDFGTAFIAKEFSFDEEIIKKWYEKFDKEVLENNNWFCEGSC
ncbi:MAG: hypothetical protein U9Q40_03175 [Campylobacterota bacterium]|nr:hypothetical protein [Campylobacterota bacterium]